MKTGFVGRETVMSDQALQHREPGQPEIDYQPFNPLSPVALTFSLLSLLTIASFIFLAAALAGFSLGIIAALGCQEGRRRSGYRLACVAVFLSVLGAVLGLSHYFGRVGWLTHVAREKAELVIQAIEDDELEQVLCLGLGPPYRPDSGTDLLTHFESKRVPPGDIWPPVWQINHWMTTPPMKVICLDRLEGQHQYLGLDSFSEVFKIQTLEQIVLRYRYTPVSADLEPFDYKLKMTRHPWPATGGFQWQVECVVAEMPTGRPEITKYKGPTGSRKRFKPAGPNRENPIR